MMGRLLARAVWLSAVTLFALVSARLVTRDPRYALAVVAVVCTIVVPAWLARRRMRRVLRSGDIGRVLASWQASVRRITYPETMGPLMTATAYAAYGFIDSARRALAHAQKGPAWDAAVEQRLFVEALLDVYVGDRAAALTKASLLESLPLPRSGFWMRRKIARLRQGVGALARAFSHTSRGEDTRVLRNAGRSSPLVYWAMRYARAIIAVDAGRADEARALLRGAPTWPEESAFRSFHDELEAKLG